MRTGGGLGGGTHLLCGLLHCGPRTLRLKHVALEKTPGGSASGSPRFVPRLRAKLTREKLTALLEMPALLAFGRAAAAAVGRDPVSAPRRLFIRSSSFTLTFEAAGAGTERISRILTSQFLFVPSPRVFPGQYPNLTQRNIPTVSCFITHCRNLSRSFHRFRHSFRTVQHRSKGKM